MDRNKMIRDKKLLIMEDEKDVLDTLVERLNMCRIDTASSFEAGRGLLESESYDLAILDIKGVNKFELLAIANARKIPVLVLTARALSEKNLKKSAEEGAAFYAPKNEIKNITVFVANVLEAVAEKKNPWDRWCERLGGFYDRRFKGIHWREEESEFWEKKIDRDLICGRKIGR